LNPWLPQFSRFALVGALCTGIQYAVLAAGVEWLGLAAAVASTAGFLLGAAVNYQLNRRYTYDSRSSHAVGILRFSTVLAAGLLLNALFMHVLHSYLHWHYALAQLLTTGITMFWNFLAHRFWTFAGRT
jgi:putative flippase GtrA